MVIHSSLGAHRKKPIQKKQENKQPVVPKKEVILEQPKVKENILFDEIFAAEVKPEITSLPKKQNRKKVTKIIEE